MSRIKVQLIKQPTKHSCVHACLSMVTGIPVINILERFGERALDTHRELTVLTEMGICPVPLPNSTEPLMTLGNVFFVTVPSLNLVGRNHAIVVETSNDGDVIVYDPSPKDHYPLDALQPSRKTKRTLSSYGDIVLLQPLPEHRGTIERLRLYDERNNQG